MPFLALPNGGSAQQESYTRTFKTDLRRDGCGHQVIGDARTIRSHFYEHNITYEEHTYDKMNGQVRTASTGTFITTALHEPAV